MNNKRQIITPLIVGIALIIGVLMGISLTVPTGSNNGESGNAYSKKLIDIFDVIEREYVDSVDKTELLEETIANMLHRLDPHSNYIPATELQRMSESIQGHFGGVGVRFTILNDTLNITHVVPGSPAEQAGIQAFDQIVRVEMDTIAGIGLTNTRVQELLKGEVGTMVNVTVIRNDEMMEKSIRRGIVPINSVLAAYMMDDQTGYIRLSQFSMQTDREFLTAARMLKKQGMTKLIFDLRHNSGGVMGVATSILDEFLAPGEIIVSTKSKNGIELVEESRRIPSLGDLDLVVLINQGSASASEIVAGAIQDNDRGIIVGRRSFGKGLVQQDIELKDGSNLRLTTSRYYTPTGRSIQKPYYGDYEEYLMDEYSRYENGELYEVDSSLFVDSLKYYTPKGRAVYGGGGIMPDVFVPLDTTGSSGYFRHLQYANAFSDFAYLFARSGKLNPYSTIEQFTRSFTISDELFQSFIKYAEEKDGIKKNTADLKHSEQRIKTELKAEIARQKWLEDGSISIQNTQDKEVIKAKEVLDNLRKYLQ